MTPPPAISQLSDIVLGLERNQQESNEELRNTTRVRVLKNRFTGETGIGGYLTYNRKTARQRRSEEAHRKPPRMERKRRGNAKQGLG